MTRVLVCMRRDFGYGPKAEFERNWLWRTLDTMHRAHSFTRLIHGNAKGDRLAGAWAEEMGIPVGAYSADWDKHRGAAGPIRNREMLVKEHPEMVIAFPGGPGTDNMIDQANKAGVPVHLITD